MVLPIQQLRLRLEKKMEAPPETIYLRYYINSDKGYLFSGLMYIWFGEKEFENDVEYIRKDVYDKLEHEYKNLLQKWELQKHVMEVVREKDGTWDYFCQCGGKYERMIDKKTWVCNRCLQPKTDSAKHEE